GDITPKGLAVTADDSSRLYGDANPNFTARYDGFVTGEDVNALGGALAFTTAATAQSNVGSYGVTPGGLTSSNYSIGFSPGTLTVPPAPLTITADDTARAALTDNPLLTATMTGFRNNDSESVVSGLTLSTSATHDSTPGEYSIVASGAHADNYSITHVNG